MIESKAILESKSQAVLSLLDQGKLYPIGMTVFADRLRSARKTAGKTQAQLAAATGVTAQAVSGWERNEAMPAPDKIPTIARIVGRTSDWLLEGDEPHVSSDEVAVALMSSENPITVKVKGYVGAGSEAHYYRLADEDYEEVPAPDGATDQTVALEIKGTSWGPLMESWLVFYKDVHSPISENLLGHTCVVGLADDRILIKKIIRDGHGGYRLLSNSSEPPIENAQIEWAAKVTDMRPR